MNSNIRTDKEVIKRYKTKYRMQDTAFRILDTISHPFCAKQPDSIPIDIRSIKKILIANAGHIGDVVISTALLSILQKAIPGVSIGFLTGTYSKKVLEGHPGISRLYCLDHWYLTRSNQSKLMSILDFNNQKKEIINQIQNDNYEMAIDLRAWYPNFIPLIYSARIPIRIGYNRVGGASLLTHSYNFQYDRRHELMHQLDLLKPLNISHTLIENARPYLPCTTEISEQIGAILCNIQRLCILHPASSKPTRDWPQKNWIRLAHSLVDRGITPVITGYGSRDAAMAEELSLSVPEAINLCNALSWDDLLCVIRKADAVYSVETSIGHIASALRRPVISIYGGMADPRHWAPLGAHIVTNEVPCHPCFKKNGCSHRLCLTDIAVEQVKNAIPRNG